MFSHEYFMKMALQEAEAAKDLNEVPIGCVIVMNDRVIARGHNLTEQLNDVTAHAEMQAITSAANFLGGKYLKDCTLYVTLEPCVMCVGAMVHARIQRLVFAANDPKTGAVCSVTALLEANFFNHAIRWEQGPFAQESAKLLQDFFQQRRKSTQ